ncbi:MAG: UDP-N-acetylglucosamine 2-epimerase (hydrolyzing) [Bacteroidales bacterium]|nr:UDP-N-acetylglucosamine 2-epimerase (hydrolyzing) [Bacteroidales bacterium]
MKKVCIVTAARSEYGLLRWVIDSVYHDPELELQLVVTGAHLSFEQGLTYRFIEEDGYPIAAKVDMQLRSDNKSDIVCSMGKCSEGFAKVYFKLMSDVVVVLGDRYELLPIVSAALVMGIPVAHISGGDVTEGAIDNEVRNAVSMMSTLHFPGVESSAENLKRMLNSDTNIFIAGEPGLESFLRYDLMTRNEIASNIGLDESKRWCLVTLHSETKLSLDDNLKMVHHLFDVMKKTENVQFVISKANADFGGMQINEFWEEAVKSDTDKFHLFSSLGQRRYLSFMQQSAGIIGNSSSGIVEAPFLGIPVVNIGERQKGRHLCKNVIQCDRDNTSIALAFQKMLSQSKIIDTYYGNGHTSNLIVAKIKEWLKQK